MFDDQQDDREFADLWLTIWLHFSQLWLSIQKKVNIFILKWSWSSILFCFQIYNSCQNSQPTWTNLGINCSMQFRDGERKTHRQYPVASGVEPQRIWRLGSWLWGNVKKKLPWHKIIWKILRENITWSCKIRAGTKLASAKVEVAPKS